MKRLTPINIDETPNSLLVGGIGVRPERYPKGHFLPIHQHNVSQLLIAKSGQSHVRTVTGQWLIPQRHAVWIPKGMPHAAEMMTDVDMRSVYIAEDLKLPQWVAPLPNKDRVIVVSPLIRSLVIALLEEEAAGDRRQIISALLIDEIARAPITQMLIPFPTNKALERLASFIVDNPETPCGLDALACRFGVSPRTISRRFPLETGLTFKQWRQRVRVFAALDFLSMGASVKKTAGILGYSSSTALSVALRTVVGASAQTFMPKRY